MGRPPSLAHRPLFVDHEHERVVHLDLGGAQFPGLGAGEQVIVLVVPNLLPSPIELVFDLRQAGNSALVRRDEHL